MYQGLNSDPHSRLQTRLPSEAPWHPIIRNINTIVKEWQWMMRNLSKADTVRMQLPRGDWAGRRARLRSSAKAGVAPSGPLVSPPAVSTHAALWLCGSLVTFLHPQDFLTALCVFWWKRGQRHSAGQFPPGQSEASHWWRHLHLSSFPSPILLFHKHGTSFFLFLLLWDKVLCVLGWPLTHGDHLPALAFQVLGL